MIIRRIISLSVIFIDVIIVATGLGGGLFIFIFFSLPIILILWGRDQKTNPLYGTQKTIQGIARMVSIRSEASYGYTSQSILNFRIEQIDKEGNIKSFMPCELRGLHIIGNITDGDKVFAKGIVVDGLMKTSEIINMTTNSIVRSI